VRVSTLKQAWGLTVSGSRLGGRDDKKGGGDDIKVAALLYLAASAAKFYAAILRIAVSAVS